LTTNRLDNSGIKSGDRYSERGGLNDILVNLQERVMHKRTVSLDMLEFNKDPDEKSAFSAFNKNSSIRPEER
jgi:hypothetical protein